MTGAGGLPNGVRTADEIIDWRWKGFPILPAGTTVAEFVARTPALFEAKFNWPVMVLRESALANNIDVLAAHCQAAGISLAPHGKTTMTPTLFDRQFTAGAWALTAATPWQARVYRAVGVARVLLANELVDAGAVDWLVAEQQADPRFEFWCYVDSVPGVELLARAAASAVRPLSVLVEIGLPGGRTGCRTAVAARAVAAAVHAAPTLSLCGVAGYEGPLGHERDPATLDAVRAYVALLGDTLTDLDDAGLLDTHAAEYLLTCGGSGQVDVVSEVLATPRRLSRPVRPVLRSGSYVSFDDGVYARTSSLAALLRPAIELWAQVLSRPEPGLALLGCGRRDVSFDEGFPTPRWRRAGVTGPRTILTGSVTALNDQHTYLEIETSAQLDVGDLVGLGISHPCTTHDKWQLVPVIDDDDRVVDCVRSYF